MTSRPMSEIWFERAADAFAKGDLDSAEIRLIISDHLNPNTHAKKLLTMVQKRKLLNRSVVDFSQFRDRKVDAEECIIIAKISIERGNFEHAKKFLILAEKYCPSYYSKKLLKKIKYLENLRIRQEAKKKFADKLTEDAQAHYSVGNFSKAEKLLLKSLKVFSTIRAQSLLKRVQDKIEEERRNSENIPTRRLAYKIVLNILNILTCNCLEACGYIRFDETDQNSYTNGRRNERTGNSNHFTSHSYDDFFRNANSDETGHSSTNNTHNTFFRTSHQNNRFSFTSEKIPHSRYFFERYNNTFQGHARTSEESRARNEGNTNNAGNRNSTQYNFTSENIPGNNTRNNNTSSHRTSEESRARNEGNTNNAGNRNSTHYNYTSENIPGNNTRNNNTSSHRTSEESRARNEGNTNNANNRNSTHYNYTSENIPGNNTRNNNTSSHRTSEESRARNEGSTNNAGNRNSTHYNFTSENIPGNNTRNNNTSSHRTSEERRARNEGSTNNAGNRNSTHYNFTSENIPGSNTRNNNTSSQNDARTRNNTEHSRNNSSSTRNASQSRRPNSRTPFKEYTEEQIQAVNRVLNSKDDYERLGIPKGSTKSELRSAFKRLALILHPDKNKAPMANEAFMAINDAKFRLLKAMK